MKRSRHLVLATVFAIIGTQISCGGAEESSAKLHSVTGGKRIEGRYVVVLGGAQGFTAPSFASSYRTRHIYNSVFNGFSAQLDKNELRDLLNNPSVEAVYETSMMRISEVQNSPTWGIDRLDQKESSLDSKYAYRANGAGVTAYVIDTGINVKHTDFGGRAIIGTDVTSDKGTTFENVDGHGHGTHVSGTIGSKTYGVAKGVTLVAVKVFDRAGSEASDETILAGIDWAIENHKQKETPAVINMSLGGAATEVADAGVRKAVEAGITVVVAAGNENQDACRVSPAREPSVITVASLSRGDRKSSFSNWGKCVDVIAPGSRITSTWKTGGSSTLDGTSMASPHVAGIAALVLSENPQKTPAEVQQFIIDNAITDAARGFNSATPNRIASTLWNLPTN